MASALDPNLARDLAYAVAPVVRVAKPRTLACLRDELTGRHDDLRTLAMQADRLRPLLAALGLDLDAVIVALGVRQGGRDLARRLALHVAGLTPKRDRPRCGARTRGGCAVPSPGRVG